MPNGDNHVSELLNTLNIHLKMSEQHSKKFIPLGKQKRNVLVSKYLFMGWMAQIKSRDISPSQQGYSTLFPQVF